MSPSDAEAAAYVLLIALEDSWLRASKNKPGVPENLGWAQVTGAVDIPAIAHIAWTFHWRRLSGIARPKVLTVAGIEICEDLRHKGILTSLVRQLLTGDRCPRVPLAHLHFQDCGPGLSRLLEREGFTRYEIGNSVDWWTPITGQKELGL